MDINRFTEKAQEALFAAQRLAGKFGNQQVDVEHLLLALLDQEQGLASAILNKADIAADALKLRVQREIERLPKVSGGSEPGLTRRLMNLLTEQAEAEAKKFKDDFLSVEHLLLPNMRGHFPTMDDDGAVTTTKKHEFEVALSIVRHQPPDEQRVSRMRI